MLKRLNDNRNNNPLERLIEYITCLIAFTGFSSIICIFMYFVEIDDFRRGQWLGFGMCCLMIFLGFISIIKGMISKEDMEEIEKEVKRMIEEQEKKNKEENESNV